MGDDYVYYGSDGDDEPLFLQLIDGSLGLAFVDAVIGEVDNSQHAHFGPIGQQLQQCIITELVERQVEVRHLRNQLQHSPQTFIRQLVLYQLQTLYPLHRLQASQREQPVRSKVSKLSLSQNSCTLFSALTRSTSIPPFPDDLFQAARLLFSFSWEGLRFLGVLGVVGGASLVQGSGLNSTRVRLCPSLFSCLGERVSCGTCPKLSFWSVSSRWTVRQLKRELATAGLSTTLICAISPSIAAILLSTLVSMRFSSASPSPHSSSGPTQYPICSSIPLQPSALANNSAHFCSHCLYFLCESFSSLMRAVMRWQTALKFLTTSSKAFFSASRTFSQTAANLRLMSSTKRSFCSPILRTTPSLNSALPSRAYNCCLRERYSPNWSLRCCMRRCASGTVLKRWSLWLPNSAQCGQTISLSFRQMSSNSFRCTWHTSRTTLSRRSTTLSCRSTTLSCELSSWLMLHVVALFSRRYFASDMFLGKHYRSDQRQGYWCPQCRQVMAVFWMESSCLRQAVQELCSQKGIMRGWLSVVKLHPHRQQLVSYSFG